MRRLLFAVLVAVFALVAAPAGLADTVRIPKTGAPALVIDAPTGWSVSYDDLGNLQLLANDKSAVIQLSMISGEESSLESDVMAARILEAAKSAPYASKQPASAAGIAGMSYLSTMPINNISLSVKVMVLRIDAAHVGSLAILTQPNIKPEQSALVQATLSLVRVEGR